MAEQPRKRRSRAEGLEVHLSDGGDVPPLESFKNLLWQQAIKAYRKLPRSERAHDVEDLVSEGVLCYLRARERFDPAKGCRFITYLYATLRNGLLNVIRKSHKTVSGFGLREPYDADDERWAEVLEAPPEHMNPADDMPKGLTLTAEKFVEIICRPPPKYVQWERETYSRSTSIDTAKRAFRFLGLRAGKEQKRCLREVHAKMIGKS